MVIQQKHIAQKRRIGNLHGQPVIEILLKGGLVLVTSIKDGKPFTAGLGPHRCVARFMAEKAEPDLELTELSKSEAGEVSLAGIMSVLPEYEILRDRWNSMPGFINGDDIA